MLLGFAPASEEGEATMVVVSFFIRFACTRSKKGARTVNFQILYATLPLFQTEVETGDDLFVRGLDLEHHLGKRGDLEFGVIGELGCMASSSI